MNSRLYIGNLSPDVSEEELRLLFSKTGPVREVTLVLDPVTHRSRGSAFVTMATPELAAAALRELHCYELRSRHITVTEARPPQEAKGMMCEGFGLEPSSPFRVGVQQRRTQGRSTGPSRRRGRSR